MYQNKVKLRQIAKIIELSKLPKEQLRELNEGLHWAYTGSELTKLQLIYQITFLADAPDWED